MDYYTFYAGDAFDLADDLGAHVYPEGTIFRTYAPNAESVSVAGTFSGWQNIEMRRVYDGRFFEAWIPEARHGDLYKYRIRSRGVTREHADPFAFHAEKRPGMASRIYDMGRYAFHDDAWMQTRGGFRGKPMNIYEIHAGSWQKKTDAEDGWFTYCELADRLIPWLKENGYNYVELMPLNEYPCDSSWGYQATGFFAVTSRYGEPDGLRALVDRCHQNGIGVILDFVTVHFALNQDGLRQYDGTCLFEYPSDDVGISEWGSCNFMHSRPEVRSFLQSAALFLIRSYHLDGLRFDAVGNLLYWQGSPARGENRGAIEFLEKMNSGLKDRCPDVLLMAEDSTAFPGVTSRLHFDCKWDLGWMNDTLRFFARPPHERPQHYHELTFRQSYARNEQYLLPLSHDECVHGKKTVVGKMYGDYEERFRQARMLYMYMYALPGKKLNFMGSEFAQLREWDEKRGQDFCLLSYPVHDAFLRYIRALNILYLTHTALSERDYEEGGFQWITCDRPEDCLYAFRRMSGNETIVFIMNASSHDAGYRWRTSASVHPLLGSDERRWGGTADLSENAVRTDGTYASAFLKAGSALICQEC